MKKLSIFAVLMALSNLSQAYEMYGLKLGLKANNLPFTESIVYPAIVQNNPVSGQLGITVADTLTTDGKVLWTIDNNSDQDLQPLQAVTYIDIEIDQVQNTFFNETAALSSLVLPQTPTPINNYLPSAPTAWQIDEPGYYGGQLNVAYQALSLNNNNELGTNADDIAVAFQHSVPLLKKGERLYIEARIGDQPTNGIQQSDPNSQQSYYLNSVIYTKAPPVVKIPPVVTITAPTTTSPTDITDTTIKVTDDVGVLVADIVIQSTSTAAYDDFTCQQTSTTKVNCTITITASGTLIVAATDSDNLSTEDSESYTITTQPSSAPKPIPSLTVLGLLTLVLLFFTTVGRRISLLNTMKVLVVLILVSSFSVADAQLACDTPTTQDIPRCAVNFQLRSKPGKVQITWSNSAEKYTIYRSEQADQPLSKLHETSVGGTTYLDTAVSNQQSYFYRLQLLDNQGNVKCISDTRSVFVFAPLSSPDFNRPPIFDSQPVRRIDENSTWEYTPVIKDNESDAVVLTWISYPATAEKEQGKISWVANTNESATFAALATDEHGAQTLQQFLVAVDTPQQQGSNRAPVITSEPVTEGLEEQPYIYTVTAVDCNPDTLTFAFVGTVPSGMQINGASGKITWPSPLPGVYPITVTVSDGQLSDTQTYDLTIKALNRPPVLTVPANQTLRLTDAGNLAITLQATATDPNLPDDELTFSVSNPPTGLTIDDKTGELTWLATAADDYLIQVTVTDKNGLSDTKTFTLNILSNLPPIAQDDTYTATSGEVLTINPILGVMQNDSDPDGDRIQVNQVLSQPSQGTVTVNPDGSLTYTPNVGGVRVFEDIDLAKHSATITASSTNGNTYPTSNLVNGFLKTPWLSEANDTQPTLTATFEHPVTIKQLKLQMPDNAGYLAANVSIIFLDESNQSLLTISPQNLPQINQWLTLNISDFMASSQSLQNVGSIKIQFQKTASNALVGLETLEVIGDGRATNFVAVEKWRYEDGPFARYFQVLVADTKNDGVPEVYAWDKESNIVLLDGNTGQVQATGGKAGTNYFYINYRYDANAAIADINNDGLQEIVVVNNGNMILYSSDMQKIWNSFDVNGRAINFRVYSGLAIADLDQDGNAEILGSSATDGICALNKDGKIYWCQKSKSVSALAVADINLDGRLEVITNRAIYSWDGQIIANTNINSFVYTGLAIANIDNDAYAEIIMVSNGVIYIYEHNYVLKKQWNLHRLNKPAVGGAPTIADFNNDGQPEIGVATADYYQVWKLNGQLLWKQPTFDNSSSITGSTVFDFEGDGISEVVYRDEKFLYVYRGSDGKILLQYPVKSGTWFEYPIVVDVDGDGEAEIVVSQDREMYLPDGTRTKPGIVVFESPIGSWVSTRKIWNQYSYHVTNINEDGSVPRIEQNNWLTPGLNNYRQNTWGINDQGQFDSFRYEIIDETGKTAEAEVHINIRPANTAPVFTSLPTIGATVNRDYRYAPTILDIDGDTVSFTLMQSPTGMTIDTNTGLLSWRPTLIGNYPVTIIVTDEHGFSSPQSFTIEVVKATNADPVINSQPDSTGKVNVEWQYQLIASDIDQDTLTYTLTESPTGMQINAQTGLINWLPSSAGAFPVTVLVTDGNGGAANQTFVITIESDNLPPRIISNPSTIAIVGQTWTYRIVAADDDGSIINYRLHRGNGTNGMTIGLNGIVSWIPTTTGTYQFSVSVVDNDGAETHQEITLNVYSATATNYAPEITSTPDINASLNALWQYDVEASDANNDTLTYTLQSAPTGMTIEEQSGLIHWRPTATGTVSFTVLVSDGNGGTASQQITLTVGPAVNSAPTITSIPTTSTTVYAVWQYDVEANDADGDTLTYSLQNEPVGMTIDAQTGLVDWTPSITGVYDFTVVVSDGRGGSVTQLINLAVNSSPTGGNPNVPVITPTPFTNPVVGKPWQYDIDATDADGDTLTYSLQNPPSGMTIDSQTGEISWTPTAEGTVTFTAVVSDGRGGETLLPISLTVQPDNSTTEPLGLSLYIIPETVNIGEDLTITVTPRNVSGNLVYRKLWVDNIEVALNVYGQATLAATDIGTHTVRAEAKDDDETVTQTGTFLVKDPSDTTAPAVKIDSPVSGDEIAVISDVTDVLVTVSDANLVEWTLSLIDQSIPNATPQLLFDGTTPQNNQNIGQLDPTLLENGIYALVLQAVDKGGNSASDLVYIQVSGEMKLGHFALTFNDVNIDTVGIPLSVNRTYDTRRRHRDLSFGHGWSVDYQNVRISENGKLGRHWITYARGSGLNKQHCIKPTTGRYVNITLPNNETHEFKMSSEPCVGIFTGNFTYDFNIEYAEVSNYGSTLAQTDYGLVRYSNMGGTEMVHDLGQTVPADPNNYVLTTKEGVKYYLDQDFGIKRIELPTGQFVTYSKDGIVHSEGLSITFNRNADDRIDSITLPDGETLTYTYSTAGDLHHSFDALDNSTEYTYYTGKYAHYLQDINDPLGNRAIRSEYDSDGRLIAQIDADGNRIELAYQIAGKTSTVKDRNGNKTIYVYDDNGNVLSETNELGETILHTYDAEDNELSITDALGNTTTMTYNRHGQVLTETNAENETETTTYAENHQPATVTDALGNVINTIDYLYILTQSGSYLSENPKTLTDGAGNSTTITYNCGKGGALNTITDAEGHTTTTNTNCRTGTTTSQVDALGHSTAYVYNTNGDMTQESTTYTNAQGQSVDIITKYTLDANGNVTETTRPDGTTTQTAYNAIEKVTAETDALGRKTTFTYTKRGEPSTTTYPDGTTSKTTYDGEGNVLTETDTAGRVTTNTYDKANRLIKTTYHDGSTTTQSYYQNGWLKSTTDQNGNTTTYEYDKAGRQTKVTRADGSNTQTEYDKAGKKTATIDAKGNRTTYTYDGAGKVIKTTFADGSSTARTYDKNSRVKTKTDQLGNVTTYAYDGVGRLTQVTDALGNVTTYTYDEQGNKTAQTDAEGRTTKWAYDVMGRVLSRTLPNGEQESFTYDAVGNVSTHTDFNGDSTGYTYDNMNRPTQVTYADGSTQQTTYTADGQVASITDSNGTISHTYDNMGRLKTTTDARGKVITYAYDSAGNKTQVTADGVVTDYTYDSLNRLKTVTDTSGTTTYTYDTNGNRASITYPNGVKTTYVYDQLNRLIKQSTEKGGQIQASYTYTLNANGQRLTMAEHSGRQSAYVYDKLGRVLSETITDALNGNHSAAYTYDKVGNRTAQTVNGVTTGYTYNANDWLLTAGSTAYTYDANGNTLTETDGADVTTYVYDKRNKLIKATTPTDTVTYQYAPNGLRTQKATGGVTIDYLLDSQSGYGDVIAEYTNGTKAKTYTIGDDLISQTQGQATFYYGYDGLGSTRMLFADTGAVTDSYDYTAFGEIHGETGTTDNTFLFTGEQYDSNVGQYYLRARYYNQAIGRFTQMDTYQGQMSDPASLHKYLYTANDPVNNTDPSGHMTVGSMMAGINTGFSIALSAVNTGFRIYNTIQIPLTIIDTVNTVRSVLNGKFSSIEGYIAEVKKDSDFSKIDFLDARIALQNNLDDISKALVSNHSSEMIGILKNPKVNFNLYLPNLEKIMLPEFTVPAGSVGMGKFRRKLYLKGGNEKINRRLRAKGRFVGFGTEIQGQTGTTKQWWRMDWHRWHGGSNTLGRWKDSSCHNREQVPCYHFHIFEN